MLRIPIWSGMHGLGITEGARIITSAVGDFFAECKFRKHELPPIRVELCIMPGGDEDDPKLQDALM